MSRLSLGEFLRQEREKRSLTIEQVASATKINVKLLLSLETDQYSDLPAKPFVRGFIISYCKFIGVDPQPILNDYEATLEEDCAKEVSNPNQSGYAFEKRDTEKSRTILLAVMGGFVVVGALVILVLKPALRHRKVTHLDRLRAAHSKTVKPEQVTSPVKEVSAEEVEVEGEKVAALDPKTSKETPEPKKVVEKKEPEKKPEPKKVVAQASGNSIDPNRVPSANDPMNKGDTLSPLEIKHKVVFKALADAWIRYKVDGRSTMRFMLRKDKLLVLRATDIIRFQTSNPNAVSFRYQNGKYSPFADSAHRQTFNSTETISFPFDASGNETEPFPGLSALPKTPDP